MEKRGQHSDGRPLLSPECRPPHPVESKERKSAQPWLHSWSAQILSALSWVQVARACDYKRMAVMRGMHKTVRRVYSASPWMQFEASVNDFRIARGFMLSNCFCSPFQLGTGHLSEK